MATPPTGMQKFQDGLAIVGLISGILISAASIIYIVGKYRAPTAVTVQPVMPALPPPQE